MKRFLRNTRHKLGPMEKQFEKMEEQGIPKSDKPTAAAAPKKEEQQLPKLSPAEFKAYNRMAEHMDMFHNHFRQTWNLLYTACKTNKRPAGMSIRTFLATAEQFLSHLEGHHGIEEVHIFPMLAQRMPAFKKELELLTQHKEIHRGMDRLAAYLRECRSGERELRLGEMGEVMDSFGGVLWEHLDDEVRALGAEEMRKYWSLEEMRRFLL